MSALADDLAKIATPRMKQARILYVDIERLPGVAYLWEPRTKYVPPSNFIEWPSLLSFAAKWGHERKIAFHASWHDGGIDAMRQAAWDLYDQAEIVCTYNGVNFDDRHLRSEWSVGGMMEPSTFKPLDLFREVRRTFGFESKSLDQVCKRYGIAGKSGRYDVHQAVAASRGDTKAQRDLERYNRADVRILEGLHHRLLGWVPGAPIIGGPVDDGELACTQCGSTDLVRNGWHRAVVQEYARYRCSNCGGQVRSNLVKRVSNTRGIR